MSNIIVSRHKFKLFNFILLERMMLKKNVRLLSKTVKIITVEAEDYLKQQIWEPAL